MESARGDPFYMVRVFFKYFGLSIHAGFVYFRFLFYSPLLTCRPSNSDLYINPKHFSTFTPLRQLRVFINIAVYQCILNYG
jgi:hypothetical protein